MAETVGVTATSTLPNDVPELLKLIVLELRVMNLYLKDGFGHTDEPSVLRQQLAKGTEIVVS